MDEHHTESSTEQKEKQERAREAASEHKLKQPSRRDTEQRDSEQGRTTLAELIGNNVPSIPLEVLKTNPRSSKSSSPVASWICAPIDNPARKDALKLKHWKRSDDQEGESSPQD